MRRGTREETQVETELTTYESIHIPALALPAEQEADIQEALADNLDGVLSRFDLPRIRIPAGGAQTWTVPCSLGEEIAVKTLTAVVLHRQGVRTYYAGEEIVNRPPDCSSDDTITGVGSPGGLCATCPFAQFGSARDGAGKGQACKLGTLLLLLTEHGLLPMLLVLPPTSLGEWKRYALNLAAAGVAYHKAVTQIGLTKVVSDYTYSRATFVFAGRVPEPHLSALRSWRRRTEGLLSQAGIASATATAAEDLPDPFSQA